MGPGFSLLVLGLVAITSYSCTTTNESSGESVYDGIVDSMDSLPDCGPNSMESIFWVKEANGAFECRLPNNWEQRKNAQKPAEEEEDGEASEAQSPRIVK